MHITGIICEYNPLHLGHKKQLDKIRAEKGQDSGIVCIMSGNFVQRGAPAIIDKSLRAKAAVLSGADLVLELPVTAVLSSAEGFAANGVRLLSGFCDELCFGAETADAEAFMRTAKALLQPDFIPYLKAQLSTGLSFPAARQAALAQMGIDASLLSHPNNILGVEYCKAILSQNAKMQPYPIHRGGRYHDEEAHSQDPSATAVRKLMEDGDPWQEYIPPEAFSCFHGAPLHALTAGQRAILAKLRTMTEADFAALPYGSEGLWRKLMHACRQGAALEEIAASVKSKRYTRTRIDRMILCAFLGITAEDLAAPAPYARVLAFNDKGRAILNTARETGDYPNIGQSIAHPYQQLEYRCNDLYSLFAVEDPEKAGLEAKRRVYYHK